MKAEIRGWGAPGGAQHAFLVGECGGLPVTTPSASTLLATAALEMYHPRTGTSSVPSWQGTATVLRFLMGPAVWPLHWGTQSLRSQGFLAPLPANLSTRLALWSILGTGVE